MKLEALHNLEIRLLQLLIIVLPLNGIPQRFSLPGLGGDLGNYVCLLMIIVLCYKYAKYRFTISKKAITFFAVFIVWQIICLALGLITYEYNELLTLEQISKLEVILAYASNFGIEINELVAIKCWLFFRFIKNILLLNNIVFFVAFYIYHLYQSDFRKAFQDIRKAVVVLVVIMGTYSFIELLWLKLDLDFAKRFFEFINPYLYEPKSSHGWWPPLLWKNQLRSICSEPSYFGILSVFCIPFLWSLLLENKHKILSSLLIFYFTLMIAATNARTAIILVFVEIICFGILTLIAKNKAIVKNFVVIISISALAFGVNLINFRQLTNNTNSQNAIVTAEKYLQNNVVSVTNIKARSNSARLANLVANLETIRQYPVFGVGYGLKDAYIDSNLPKFAYSNNEVKTWSRYMHAKGVLKSGYPALNKYTDIAVQNGLIGLCLYFCPLLYILKKLYENKRYLLRECNIIMVIITMIALLGAMISNSVLVICNGIIWGLLFCKIKEIENRKYEKTNFNQSYLQVK